MNKDDVVLTITKESFYKQVGRDEFKTTIKEYLIKQANEYLQHPTEWQLNPYNLSAYNTIRMILDRLEAGIWDE